MGAVARFVGPLPSENYLPGRLDHTMQFGGASGPSYVVIHTMAGTVDTADALFKDPKSRLSSHYGVGLDGTVVQWVSESDTAYHASNWDMNLSSVGIQHEDGGSTTAPRTDALYAASSNLVRDICVRYGIPISPQWIIKHHDVPGAATMCPDALDVNRIVSMASGSWLPAAAPDGVPTPAPAPEVVAASAPVEAEVTAGPTPVEAPPPVPPPAIESVRAQPPPPPAPTPLTASPPAAALQPTGDPLRDMASMLYGDAGRWQEIYNAIQGVAADAPVLALLTKLVAGPPPDTTPSPEASAPEPPPPPASTADAPPAAPAPAQGPPPPPPSRPEKAWGGSQGAVFTLQILYLIGLAALAVIYFTNRSLINVPETLGPISVAVPWFGALGAVLISLVGITQHRRDWDPSYRFWHWSRPLLGASFGSISVLMFEAGILAVGSLPTSGAQDVPKNLLYYLIAFVVGYREETFRDLIKRLTDILFTPGAPAGGLSATSISRQSGPAAGGTPVTVLGSGLSDTSAVRFGTTPAHFQIDGDTQLTVTSPPGQTGSTVNVVIATKSASAIAGAFTFS
jgi:hypothetical protein